MTLYHDSRDPYFRNPVGAGGVAVRVALRLFCDPMPDAAVVRLWHDGVPIRVPMAPEQAHILRAELTLPDAPGVLWYYFLVVKDGAESYYGNAADQLGGVGQAYPAEPPSYQITVFDPAYQTPEWMREGLLYQIMVDRFCAGVDPARKTPPEDGEYHARWDEKPVVTKGKPESDARYDFFGGDLAGVMQKLPYLRSMGVTALYLNPIFRACSNHKYDTGDYETVDPSFGDNEAFSALCARARALGIRILLDGVFSHTGANSRYFNRDGRYPTVGAYQSPESPFASWYHFKHFPDDYDCWWNFKALPNVNEMAPSYLEYLIDGADAICAKWLRLGASGWRLDVADELPVPFLKRFRARVKREDPDACVLGEVWENASNKVAYGQLRPYCVGDMLDSCMNYPLRELLLGFMLGRIDARQAKRRFDALAECYPAPFLYSLMNFLGTHDTPRVLSVLADDGTALEPPYEKRRATRLSKDRYALAARRFVALWRFLCALPGMPCLYYADEAGATGMADPFCRGPFPWGQEDKALQAQIADINRTRAETPLLKTGAFRLYAPNADALAVVRCAEGGVDAFGKPMPDGRVLCALSRRGEAMTIAVPEEHAAMTLDAVSCVMTRL